MSKTRKRPKHVKIPCFDIADDNSAPMMDFEEFNTSQAFSDKLQRHWRQARKKGFVPKPASQVTLSKPRASQIISIMPDTGMSDLQKISFP